MPKNIQDLDRVATKRDLVMITDAMWDIANSFIKELHEGVGTIQKELRTELKGENKGIGRVIAEFRLEERLNWEEQRRFNKQLLKKIDKNTALIIAINKRLQYREDLRKRLKHVENQQYELTRRVTALEK